MYHAENRLNDIPFDKRKLLKIIQSLDASKAHECDDIAVTMLKLSSQSIIKLRIFVDDWKKGNIVSVYKKQ